MFKKVIAACAALSIFCCAALADESCVVFGQIPTVQAFTDEAVSQEDLEKIVTAGLSASSAMNQQPWEFVVVTNDDVIAELASGMGGMKSDKPHASLGDSPAVILIYTATDTKSTDTSFDCGLACQNMVVAANELGYGTKIIASSSILLNGDQHDAWCEKFGIDTSMQHVAAILLGYADTALDGWSGATERGGLDEKAVFID